MYWNWRQYYYAESRKNEIKIEWMLNKSIFDSVVSVLEFKPKIDLFATRINTQLDKFASYRPNTKATHINAFTLNWSGFFNSMYFQLYFQKLKYSACISTFFLYTKNYSKDSVWEVHRDLDCTKLVKSAMVPISVENINFWSLFLLAKTSCTCQASQRSLHPLHYYFVLLACLVATPRTWLNWLNLHGQKWQRNNSELADVRHGVEFLADLFEYIYWIISSKHS